MPKVTIEVDVPEGYMLGEVVQSEDLYATDRAGHTKVRHLSVQIKPVTTHVDGVPLVFIDGMIVPQSGSRMVIHYGESP